MLNSTKITSLGLLRGLAVIFVCFCHFGKPVASGNILPGLFKWLGEYGKYGVQIFFVISGFVIPYSLFKAKYTLKDYFKFLYKRLLRLHPPYLIALFLTLVIAYGSHRARHLAYPETFTTICQSLFYIHAPADNPVFWTLKIEAEYYIFIGLFFVLLTKFPKLSIVLIVPVLLFISQTSITQYIELFTYIVYFLIGIVGYLIYVRGKGAVLEVFVLVSLIAFSFVFDDLAAGLAATFTIAIILFFRKPIPHILELPGEISYSVYLIHFVIGTKIINVLQKHVGPNYNWALFILALFISFGLGWVFWKFIEKPSAQLSNKVKYGKQKTEFLNYPVADT